MASQLNGYHNFIDIRTKEGQSLVSNAFDKFISPLTGNERIQPWSKDFQKLKNNFSNWGCVMATIISSSIVQQFRLLFQRLLLMLLPFLQSLEYLKK